MPPLEQLFGDLQPDHCRPDRAICTRALRCSAAAGRSVASRLASRTQLWRLAPRCVARGVNSDGNQFSLSVLNKRFSGPDRTGVWPCPFTSERGGGSRLSVTRTSQSRSVSDATCWVAFAHWQARRQTRRGLSLPRSQATCVGTYRSSWSGSPMPGRRPELDPP